ncbi:MAG: hypothetical protein ACK2UJ_09635, partial [Candidatus Promineifilaceae bacterium]
LISTGQQLTTSLREREVAMVEKREKHRRHYEPVTQFPLHTRRGDLITSERRKLPTRRVNDIQVKEITIDEFISGLR